MDEPDVTKRRTFLGNALGGVVALSVALPTTAAPTKTAAFTKRQIGHKAFDVVIAGGGSAGAVLAARLSEDSNRKVLLLEAGQAFRASAYPANVANADEVGADTGVDWGYKSEPGYVGHPIGAVRGKVLGGSSAVNGAVALRARPQDFLNWNLPGWSYEEMLPFFEKLENSDASSPPSHARGGPFPVHLLDANDVTPMQAAFIEATLANGYKPVADFDGDDIHGVGPYWKNVVNGVRVNTGMAYLTDEVRARPNLEVRGGVLIDRVIIDHGKAVAIRTADGELVNAGQIVLSAGAYGSPAILLRSGIGPQRDLTALGIPVVQDSPVGMRLKDHPFYYNAYAARPDRIGRQSPAIGAKLWTRTSSARADDMDIHITATHLFPHERSPTKVGFVLAVALTRPESVGRIWLASRDPNIAPRIDLNFLAEPIDRARLMEGVRLARRIGATAPLSAMVSTELAPGPKADSDAEIQKSINETLDTYHHPVASARMGIDSDPWAVVDLQGRVRGVRGLFVIDSSIIPDALSVATNITTIAIAERLADSLRR